METQTISLSDVLAALGPDAVMLRLVALQRRVAELEAEVTKFQNPPPTCSPEPPVA